MATGRALADADRRLVAPPQVEALVMQAWHQADVATPTPGPQPRPRRAALLGAAAFAAAVLLVAALQRSTLPIPVARPPEAEPSRTPNAVAAPMGDAAASPAAAPTARRPTAPAAPRAPRTSVMVLVSDPLLDPSAATVVRVRVPRSALATLGIPLVEPDGGGAVDLEMLVGEDGIARTIQRAVPVRAPASQE